MLYQNLLNHNSSSGISLDNFGVWKLIQQTQKHPVVETIYLQVNQANTYVENEANTYVVNKVTVSATSSKC